MKTTKRTKQTRLPIEREVLRELRVGELRAVDGGGQDYPDIPTAASDQAVCCA
jgi:hypothetical protein